MWKALTEHEQTEVWLLFNGYRVWVLQDEKSSENGSMAMVAQQYEGT